MIKHPEVFLCPKEKGMRIKKPKERIIMLEISLFLPLHPTELNQKLKQIGFKESKGSMHLLFDEKELRIRALRGQNNFEKTYGYRIHSDLSVSVLIYVLDMVLGDQDILVKGITKTTQSTHITLSNIRSLNVSPTDMPNVFFKGETAIMNQPSLDCVYFQQRQIKCVTLSQLYRRIQEIEQLYAHCLGATQDVFAYESSVS